MARYKRQRIPGALIHVISRFVNREYRIADDVDREAYLERLGRTIRRTDWRSLSYALMSNHIHGCNICGSDPLWRIAKPLHTSFARWLNSRHGNEGPVFADRPFTKFFEMEYAARLIAYHHNNPVRAGVVSDPSDSSWTSHRAYVGLVAPPPWLNVELGLCLSGFDSSPRGRSSFHDFVVSQMREPRDPWLSGDGQDEARATTRRLLGSEVEIGYPLGRTDGSNSHTVLTDAGVLPRSRCLVRPEIVAQVVAARTRVSVTQMRSKRRDRRTVETRKLVAYVGNRLMGLSLKSIAAFLGISQPSASHLVKLVADGDPGRLALAESLAQECWRRATN